MKQDTHPSLLPFLLVILCLGLPFSPLHAANPTPPLSIPELTRQIKPSLALITHYGRDGEKEGVGSGFVISPDGLIATALHVIGEARPIQVTLSDGTQLKISSIFASDPHLDLAILKTEATNLPSLSLGDSDTLLQGESVLAFGNPLGLEYSVVEGVLSAHREIDDLDMLQIAIPIEPGNSGGPLVDRQGRVHGILTLKSALSPNLGFAMPVNALKSLLKQPNPIPLNRWLTIGQLNPNEWSILFDAHWHQKNGTIQVEGSGSGFGGRSLCLRNGMPPSLPFEMEVMVKLEDESGAAGLVFGSDGNHRHYGFYPSAGNLRLTRFDGPDVYSWNILNQAPSPHYKPGEWNRLKIRWETERFLCYVNEHLVFESQDQHLQGGKIGLAKFRDTKASFRQFRVGPSLPSQSIIPPKELVQSLTTLTREAFQQTPPELPLDAYSRLLPHGALAVQELQSRATELEQLADRYRTLAQSIHDQEIQSQLLALLAAPHSDFPLFHAGLLVAKWDNPDLDIESTLSRLHEMASEIRELLPTDPSEEQALQTLIHYLFEENGFHGSRLDYYNQSNSYLNEVLDHREGLPLTLSILFMELATPLGLNIQGISLPRHFVVRFQPSKAPARLLDIFHRARNLPMEEALDTYLRDFPPLTQEKFLTPATSQEIIIRMIRNLLGIAEGKGDYGKALRYQNLILQISPFDGQERLARARLYFQTRNWSGVRSDFQWLLDHSPPGVDLEQIRELLRSLQ